ELREHSAHRGLTHEQALRRARDVLFLQQRIERKQKVQIELPEIHALVLISATQIPGIEYSEPQPAFVPVFARIVQSRGPIARTGLEILETRGDKANHERRAVSQMQLAVSSAQAAPPAPMGTDRRRDRH